MFIVGVKDKLAKKFIQIVPTANLDVLKRDFKNVFSQKNNIMAEFPEDFDIYNLGSIEEESGVCTPTVDLLFNLAEIKDEVQVQ